MVPPPSPCCLRDIQSISITDNVYFEPFSRYFPAITKVWGEKISSVDAIKALVTVYDMTHKPLYFDEKPESGGNSHEMIKIMARAGGRQM